MKKRMKTLLAVFILTALCLLTFTLPINAATLYVATTGTNTSPYETWTKAATSIQTAVDAASNGDVIYVGSSGTEHGTGIYNEYVVVNKQLTIQSESGYATTTVYTSDPVKDVFYVASATPSTTTIYYVTIDGFTVYGATSSHNGIYLENAKDCVIQNNRCGYDASHYNSYGIYLFNCSRNYIYNNICNNDGSSTAFGIYLEDSDRNTISNNECKYNYQAGLSSYNSDSNMNTISNNTISNNDLRGITLSGSLGNFILNNTIHNNGTGISFHLSANYNRIYLNSFNNTTNVNSSSTNYWRPGANTAVALSYFYSSANNKTYMGNYWDDYTASTSVDGIGTNPAYSPGSDGNNDDRPLISDINNYDLLVWYLNDDGNMYKDLPNKKPFSKIISSSSSTIWIADEAAQVDLTFPSGIWRGQICIVDINGNNPASGHSFTLEIGYSTNGTDFTAGPSATLTANGTTKVFEYVTSSAAVSVDTGKYLALRITNNNATNYYAWTGGAWSYTSSPGNGDPNYSLPVELSVFTAQVINNTPTIYWSTQSETDNLGWYVYRNNTNNFITSEKVSGLIDGYGTTTEPHSYIYEDYIEDAFPGDTYWYWLESIDYGGMIHHFDKTVQLTILPGNEPGQNEPETQEQFGLFQNNPNPFNPKTKEATEISFNLKEQAYVEINIYNIKGELVKTIYNGFNTADEAVWDGKDENGNLQATGIYLYELKVNNKMYSTKKIILIK